METRLSRRHNQDNSNSTEEHMPALMEAFLEAQTQFLELQKKFAAEEELSEGSWKRSKLIKLQEEQSNDVKTQREASEKMKQRMKQAD